MVYLFAAMNLVVGSFVLITFQGQRRICNRHTLH